MSYNESSVTDRLNMKWWAEDILICRIGLCTCLLCLAVDLALTADCENKIFLNIYFFFRNCRKGPISELVSVGFCEKKLRDETGHAGQRG